MASFIDLSLPLWWVFPAAVVFSCIAVGTGVSGALFFSPFFMLAVGLAPAQAVGAGILTAVFGMGNGLRAYVGQGAVDYRAAAWVLATAVPTAGAGALFAHRIPADLLRGTFGVGLVLLALLLLTDPMPKAGGTMHVEPDADDGDDEPGDGDHPTDDEDGPVDEGKDARVTIIRTQDGRLYVYPACGHLPTALFSAFGGLLTGLISAGLPEINTTQLVRRCAVPPRIAIATSVFCLAITAVVAAVGHALVAAPAWHVVVWSIPGVLVGSTVGSAVGPRLPAGPMEWVLGIVFALVGIAVLAIALVP